MQRKPMFTNIKACYTPSLQRLRTLLLLCFIVGLGSSVQAQPSLPKDDLYKQLFANPTGKNGYEDWVRAATLLAQYPDEVQKLGDSHTSLSQIRRILSSEPMRQVRGLIRAGLSKPILSPRDSKTMDLDTTFPEYASLRGLSRLLWQDIRLSIAEGRNSEALLTLREGLWMGKSVQMDVVIGGLVGIAMETIVLTPFMDDLATFSVKDSLALEQVVQDWQTLPSPLESMIDKEEKSMISSLKLFKRQHERLLEMFEPDQDADTSANEMHHYFKNNPNAIAPLVDQLLPKIKQSYNEMRQNMRRMPWERTFPEQKEATLVEKLAFVLSPSSEQLLSRFDAEKARLFMARVRAALRRYWWENGHYPRTLEVLKPMEIIVDPNSGKPFLYTLKGNSYELRSAK